MNKPDYINALKQMGYEEAELNGLKLPELKELYAENTSDDIEEETDGNEYTSHDLQAETADEEDIVEEAPEVQTQPEVDETQRKVKVKFVVDYPRAWVVHGWVAAKKGETKYVSVEQARILRQGNDAV